MVTKVVPDLIPISHLIKWEQRTCKIEPLFFHKIQTQTQVQIAHNFLGLIECIKLWLLLSKLQCFLSKHV